MNNKELIQKIIEQGKTGDVLFTYNTENLFSRLIYKLSIIRERNLQKEKMSHVAVYLHDGVVAEMYFGGLRMMNLKHYSKPKYKIFWARTKNVFDTFIFYKYILSRVGIMKYSISQIFVIAIKKIIKLDKVKDFDRDGMECVEFIINAFTEVGIIVCPGFKPWEATPYDLYKSKELEVIK